MGNVPMSGGRTKWHLGGVAEQPGMTDRQHFRCGRDTGFTSRDGGISTRDPQQVLLALLVEQRPDLAFLPLRTEDAPSLHGNEMGEQPDAPAEQRPVEP